MTSCLLGSGEFGLIYKGSFIPLDTLDPIEAAVKTMKSNASSNQLLSLLNELKVLSYLENGHRNILYLHGACTSNVRYGEAYVCVELCKDNLRSILIKSRDSGTFNQPMYTSKTEIGHPDKEVNLSTVALMKWACQIADGMEFLTSKNVIHGDLAARNILISVKYSEVKIADFGLGHIPDDFEHSKADDHYPNPWRWMAIESLTENKFSRASDVWAFGITLWEIFSLGETPYSGLSFTTDFVVRLRNGMRLEIPQFGLQEIYTLQKMCWEEEPSIRPEFSTIKSNIGTILGIDSSGYDVV